MGQTTQVQRAIKAALKAGLSRKQFRVRVEHLRGGCYGYAVLTRSNRDLWSQDNAYIEHIANALAAEGFEITLFRSFDKLFFLGGPHKREGRVEILGDDERSST